MKKTILILFFILLGFSSVAGREDRKVPKLDRSQPLNITSDKVEIIRNKTIIIFTGNVKATQGVFELFADKMEVSYNENQNDKMSIQTIKAYSNVRFNTDRIFAKGDEGHYDVVKGIVKLTNNVTAVEDGISISAQQFDYNIITGKSKIIGNKGSNERVTIILDGVNR